MEAILTHALSLTHTLNTSLPKLFPPLARTFLLQSWARKCVCVLLSRCVRASRYVRPCSRSKKIRDISDDKPNIKIQIQ